jgi:hypothetical protein
VRPEGLGSILPIRKENGSLRIYMKIMIKRNSLQKQVTRSILSKVEKLGVTFYSGSYGERCGRDVAMLNVEVSSMNSYHCPITS